MAVGYLNAAKELKYGFYRQTALLIVPEYISEFLMNPASNSVYQQNFMGKDVKHLAWWCNR